MKSVRIRYFAVFRELRGLAEEEIEAPSSDLRELYAELQRRYGFALEADQVRVAINDELVSWDHALRDRDSIAFLPPVSGG